jgi:hypothetical protein
MVVPESGLLGALAAIPVKQPSSGGSSGSSGSGGGGGSGGRGPRRRRGIEGVWEFLGGQYGRLVGEGGGGAPPLSSSSSSSSSASPSSLSSSPDGMLHRMPSHCTLALLSAVIGDAPPLCGSGEMHFQSTDRGGPSGPSGPIGPSGPTPPNTYNNSASLPYLERRHPQSSQPWFTAATDTAADSGGGGGDGLWAWTGLLGPRSRRPAGMCGSGPPTASLSLSDGGGAVVGGGGVTFRLGDTMPVSHMLEWTVISTLEK